MSKLLEREIQQTNKHTHTHTHTVRLLFVHVTVDLLNLWSMFSPTEGLSEAFINHQMAVFLIL